ncbi:MAG: hypothetical protein U0R49_09065 [Fimbriimonadales bacterium]
MQTENEIRKAAAKLGPGYKGERESPTPEERKQQAEMIAGLWSEQKLGEQPPYLSALSEITDWRDRPAKLFEIGEYKDKNLSVSEADLQKLAANFDLPVPILIEHTENPLHLGYLTDVQAAGSELFGLLTLTPEADELLRASNATSLSVCVSKDFDAIFEVSVVSSPRVESARLFCHNFCSPTSTDIKVRELEQERDEREISQKVEKLIRVGKVAPAKTEAIKVLFSKAKLHNFEKELTQLLDILPSRALMSEIAPSKLDRPTGITADEEQFYRMHFAGLDLQEISKRKEKN